EGKKPVALPVTLSIHAPYAFSSIFEISDIGQIESGTPDLSLDSPRLNLNTLYTWYVTPCWGYQSEIEKCEDSARAGPFHFKTTGEAVKIIYPEPEAKEVPIPVKFKWEKVPGAKSYIFTLADKEPIILLEPEILVDYPELLQETNYSWQIQTCARSDGRVCGEPITQSFTTFRLAAPINPGPENGGILLTTELAQFSWDEIPGAKYYQFKIIYSKAAEGEEKECIEQEGKEIAKIVAENSNFVPLECKGRYQWQVRGCLDPDCKEAGDWSIWKFNLTSPPEECQPGLIPCGKNCDAPSTPWDETKSCQPKHIFIMLKIIIDFLLFKLAPICLALLVAASGVIFYFSLKAESATPLAKVKSLWRAAGIGFGILLLAWSLISLGFSLIGYQFGPWWSF
ncbi:MAG: hypothetical protein COT36_02415, partial [Parcubacteria group bacterium CG08_land_8_20_14_0_20_38_56]